MPASVGDGPVLCAKRWRSLPQMPPTVTATRAHASEGSAGSGRSTRDAGKVGSAMSNCTARTIAAYARRASAGSERGHGRAHRRTVRCVQVPDATLDEVREHGFALLEDFLTDDELRAAQDALWLHFPRPDDYFADPARHSHYAQS